MFFGGYMRESTLLEVQQDDECRCVTFRARNDQIEVGEKTSGSLTYDVYGTSSHYHCVWIRTDYVELCAAHLAGCLKGEASESIEDLLTCYFADDLRFLADLMDDLDVWNVPYGYLNGGMFGSMAYRPYERGNMAYPALQLVV